MSESRWLSGIDEPLPPGEALLWRGSPDAGAVARHVLHQRVWGAYLGGLALLVGTSAAAALPMGDVARVMVLPLLLTALVLGAVQWMARAMARTSEYFVTSKRVVLRVGIAFPIAINIPLRLIDQASLREFRDGSGEVRLVLSPEVKLAYIALWPHVETLRHLAHPRPKLRGLLEPTRVGSLLSAAIAADAGVSAPPVPEQRRDAGGEGSRARAPFPAGHEVLAR